MNAPSIRRGETYAELAITTSAATTGKVTRAGLHSGEIHNKSGGARTMTFYSISPVDGSASQVVDSAGSPVSRTVGDDQATLIPDECFGAVQLAIVGDSAGTLHIVNVG